MQHMRRLVDDSLGAALIRDELQRILAGDTPRDDLAHARSIRRYLQEHVWFLSDPRGAELLHEPEFLVAEIRKRGRIGVDCDDAAILGASLGKNIGLRAYFQVVGFLDPKTGPYQHIYTLLDTGSGLLELDTTKPPGAMIPTRFGLEEV